MTGPDNRRMLTGPTLAITSALLFDTSTPLVITIPRSSSATASGQQQEGQA
jgi:hypothetical protein